MINEPLKNNCSFEEMLNLAKEYSCQWVYAVYTDKILLKKIDSFNSEEKSLIECKLFNSKVEINIWKENQKFKGIILKEEATDLDNILIDKQILKDGTILVIKQLVDYDEDCQAYVKACRMAEVRVNG